MQQIQMFPQTPKIFDLTAGNGVNRMDYTLEAEKGPSLAQNHPKRNVILSKVNSEVRERSE
jgi:hypothetical protein